MKYWNKIFIARLTLLGLLLLIGCSGMEYNKTVKNVDLNQFLKKWYVIAGRVTFLEQGAHNAIEDYRYNKKEDKIDIDFYFNADAFDGPLKRIPQTAWLSEDKSNARWKVSPFWPLKFDYLVIALADDYSWTVIGVPNGKYIWIMADKWNLNDSELDSIIKQIDSLGYPTENIKRIPQKW